MSNTPATIELFYDYGSPFTSLLDTQIEHIADAHGAVVKYRPMLLGGVFKATGNRSPILEECKPKAAYGSAHLQRLVSHYGVDFAFNESFPINTLQLMRVAHAALDTERFSQVHRAIFRGVWADNRNLGDAAEIAAVLKEASADADALLARASEPTIKDALRATTDEAVERGVFGAPTLFVDGEMYFGNDHLFLMVAALEARAR